MQAGEPGLGAGGRQRSRDCRKEDEEKTFLIKRKDIARRGKYSSILHAVLKNDAEGYMFEK